MNGMHILYFDLLFLTLSIWRSCKTFHRDHGRFNIGHRDNDFHLHFQEEDSFSKECIAKDAHQLLRQNRLKNFNRWWVTLHRLKLDIRKFRLDVFSSLEIAGIVSLLAIIAQEHSSHCEHLPKWVQCINVSRGFWVWNKATVWFLRAPMKKHDV